MMKLANGFTLIELLVAITIGAILMIFVVAPYNFYSEKSRARLSAERVTQAITKAKMMAVSGYAPQGRNVDLAVALEKESEKIYTYSFISTGSGGKVPSKTSSEAVKFEDIPLESGVKVSKIPLG
jgi:prepilin-type N-terminal cleavage/methylation domain-containing protein